MAEQLTVAELAKRENTTPQVINMWVNKQGLPCVINSKPRVIDVDVYTEWLKSRTTQKRERRQAERTNPDGTPKAPAARKSAIGILTQQERQMIAWSRGEGRGWALGMPASPTQSFDEGYITLVNTSGREHFTTERRLLQEAKEGKLFFMDPCEVVAFLTGHLAPIVDQDASWALRRAVDHLSVAATELALWRDERKGLGTEARQALVEEVARQALAEDEVEAE